MSGRIASSKAVKLAALVAAGAVHAGIAWALYTEEEALIDSAQGGQTARTGSFADLVQGTIQAEDAAEAAEPVAPEPVEAELSPDETPRSRPKVAERPEGGPTRRAEAETAPQPVPAPTKPDVPDRLAAIVPPKRAEAPARVAPAAEPAPDTAAPPDALAALLPQRADGLVAVTPEPAAPAKPVPLEAPVPERETPEPVQPVAPEPLAPVETVETAPEIVEAVDPDSAAPMRSLRPARRSAEFEERQKTAPEPQRRQTAEPQRRPEPERQAQRGNADQNARSGAATGQADAQASQQGTRQGRAQQAGNAAASNYPGEVMARINRVGRPRMNHRGRSRVSFTIAGSGGLAGVTIAQSSGTGALDRAAIQVIQRAAPFPPPPPGANRSYSLWIEFR